MNWIQLNKNFVSFNDNEIVYTPPAGDEKLSSIYSQDANERKDARNKFTSKIKASEYFENGIIEFDIKFDNNKLGYFNITLGEFVFAINSTISGKAYAIQKDGDEDDRKTIDKSGELGSITENVFFNVKIRIQGSNIQFLVKDVVVCEAIGVIDKSQMSLKFRSTDKIIIRNFKTIIEKPKVFVIMQFTDAYNELYKDVIKPVCEKFGYICIRADEFYQNSLILNDIIESLKQSSVIIADITPDNPNVFYEVGFAHALNKPTILLSDKKREKLPFDVSGFRTLFYDNTIGGKSKVEENLEKHLEHLNSKFVANYLNRA